DRDHHAAGQTQRGAGACRAGRDGRGACMSASKGHTILLVDDEPAVLYTLSEVLSERGHRVLTARSGNEALTKLDEAETVLTDLSMPGMDGLELMAQITSRDSTLPIILLTAHGSERVAVAAIKQGAYDYLAKPFDIDEVALVIERALEARRLRVDNRRLAA